MLSTSPGPAVTFCMPGWQYSHAPPRCRVILLAWCHLQLERHLEAEKTIRGNIHVHDPRLHWWKFRGDLSILTELIDHWVIGFEIRFPALNKYINREPRKTKTLRNHLKSAWEAGKLQRIQHSNRVSHFYSQNIRFYIHNRCIPIQTLINRAVITQYRLYRNTHCRHCSLIFSLSGLWCGQKW